MEKGSFVYNRRNYSGGGSGGSGDANFWEGTLEEFEAQKDSIPDGTLLNIKDDKESIGDINALVDAINGEDVAPIPKVYDDVERVIGTWFGKPLYRKVFIREGALVTGDNTVGYIDNFESLVSAKICGRNSSRTSWSNYTAPNNTDGLYVKVYDSDKKLVVSAGQQWSNPLLYITVEYTKVGD